MGVFDSELFWLFFQHCYLAMNEEYICNTCDMPINIFLFAYEVFIVQIKIAQQYLIFIPSWKTVPFS